MKSLVTVVINGTSHTVCAANSVLAVLTQQQLMPWRYSVAGDARAPLCGIGICFECRVRVNGVVQRACQMLVSDGMEINTNV